MLTEQDLELLTAFVDGELSNRRREAALRLLNGSSEARLVLRDLQENAHRLRELPRRQLPADFTADLLQTLQQRGPTRWPAPTPAAVRRRRVPWVAVAAAAAILLAALGGYLLLQPTEQKPVAPGPGLAVKVPSLNPWVGAIADGAVQGFGKPMPPGIQIAFRDLDQLPQRQKLTQELKKETAHRLELAVRNQRQAVDRLNTVLKEQNIRLLMDSAAQAMLKKQERTQLVLYAENLQPDEVAAILERLNPDAKAKEPSAPFESLWLTAFTSKDQEELAGLLGAKAEEFRPPTKAEDEKLFKETLIEKTTPKDSGGKKTGDNSKQAPPFRYAVVLANTSPEPGVVSPQVKTFLESRQRRPGTVQLVIFLQPATA